MTLVNLAAGTANGPVGFGLALAETMVPVTVIDQAATVVSMTTVPLSQATCDEALEVFTSLSGHLRGTRLMSIIVVDIRPQASQLARQMSRW